MSIFSRGQWPTKESVEAKASEILECGCAADAEDPCEKCCEHTDIEDDERCCLICGADVTDMLMSKAEWLYESTRD